MRQAKGEQVRRELLPGQSVELLKELHLVGRDGALHADSLRTKRRLRAEEFFQGVMTRALMMSTEITSIDDALRAAGCSAPQ